MVEYTQLGLLLKDRMFFVARLLIVIDRCSRKSGFWECRIKQRDSMYVSLHAHSQDYSDCEQDGLPSCSYTQDSIGHEFSIESKRMSQMDAVLWTFSR